MGVCTLHPWRARRDRLYQERSARGGKGGPPSGRSPTTCKAGTTRWAKPSVDQRWLNHLNSIRCISTHFPASSKQEGGDLKGEEGRVLIEKIRVQLPEKCTAPRLTHNTAPLGKALFVETHHPAPFFHLRAFLSITSMNYC